MAASNADSHPWPLYNARYRVIFPILDADGDLVTGATGLDSELSQDQGTFADATNEATEIATSSGMYYLDIIATELDTRSTAVIVKTSSAGAKTTPIVLYPRRLPVIRTGTAQAGTATTITLDASASAKDDYYNGCYVNITNNSPANVQGQARPILDYAGSTKVATVSGWGTDPTSASTFEILLPGDIGGATAWAGTAVVDPTTVGRPNINLTHVNDTAINNLIAGRINADAVAISGSTVAADNVEANIANLDATVSTRATPAQVNAEVVDGLNVDTYAEPTGAPSATSTLATKIGYLFMTLRNKLTVTGTFKTFYDDTDATEWKKPLTDDGTTYTEGEGVVP